MCNLAQCCVKRLVEHVLKFIKWLFLFNFGILSQSVPFIITFCVTCDSVL